MIKRSEVRDWLSTPTKKHFGPCPTSSVKDAYYKSISTSVTIKESSNGAHNKARQFVIKRCNGECCKVYFVTYCAQWQLL